MELGQNISHKIIQGLAMKCISFLLILSVLVSCKTDRVSYEEAGNFQLAAPIIQVDSTLFKQGATITMSFGFPNSEIRYSLDGNQVDGGSPVYEGPIAINKASTIKAVAFHTDFKSSEQTVVQVEKIKHKISDATITIAPEPHANYRGLGATSLVDMQKGSSQFRGGTQWLGFQTGKTTITIDLANALELSLIKVSCLQNQGGWIFSPKEIVVHSGSKEVGKVAVENAGEQQENQLKVIPVPIKEDNYSQLRVTVFLLDEIPQWHQGKGTTPWLFLDEILVE